MSLIFINILYILKLHFHLWVSPGLKPVIVPSMANFAVYEVNPRPWLSKSVGTIPPLQASGFLGEVPRIAETGPS